jgi:hypothetical protein
MLISALLKRFSAERPNVNGIIDFLRDIAFLRPMS